MSQQQKSFVVRTPLRKQLGGLWLLVAAAACFILWDQGLKGSGSGILAAIGGILVLLGLYRLLSFDVSVFKSGEPRLEKFSYHFGFIKKVDSAHFDKLELLRRDALLPYCQLYAYCSKEKLAEELSDEALALYEKKHAVLPGLVVVDHTSKKDCLKLIEAIWRFYGLWEEPVEEEKPAPQKEDDDWDDDDDDWGED